MNKEETIQIGITIPKVMHDRIRHIKDDFGLGISDQGNVKRTMAEICREALKKALIEAEAHHAYRQAGITDGLEVATFLLEEDQKYISRVLSESGPYKKWSKFQKIEELKHHFENIKSYEIRTLYPRFIAVMDNAAQPLHDWVCHPDNQIAEDRRAEVAWSYMAGCYEGIYDAYQSELQRK